MACSVAKPLIMFLKPTHLSTRTVQPGEESSLKTSHRVGLHAPSQTDTSENPVITAVKHK